MDVPLPGQAAGAPRLHLGDVSRGLPVPPCGGSWLAIYSCPERLPSRACASRIGGSITCRPFGGTPATVTSIANAHHLVLASTFSAPPTPALDYLGAPALPF